MDKLELDERVSRLERRVSVHSALAAAAVLATLAAIFFVTVSATSIQYEETATATATTAPRSDFERELRNAHTMLEQGLITREDFEQKKELILLAPLDPSDDLESLRAARTLVDESLLTEDEYNVLKRKVLKFAR